jgi:hypothetical protein
MAINLVTAPLATAPNVFSTPVINNLQVHSINAEVIQRVSAGYVMKGAVFSIGGSLYVCDGDTAITGTQSTGIAVKLTPSGSIASPSYVSSLTGVTWNGDNHGWYDGSGNLYIKLKAAGDYVISVHAGRIPIYAYDGTYMPGAKFISRVDGIIRLQMPAASVDGREIYVRAYVNGGAVGSASHYTAGATYGSWYDDIPVMIGDAVEVRVACGGVAAGIAGYLAFPAMCCADESEDYQSYWRNPGVYVG